MKNYYEILEVDRKASDEIIKKIFKIHIKNNHPDLFTGDEKLIAEEKIKEITGAYDTLSDPTKRKAYDEKLDFEQLKTKSEDNSQVQILKEENYVLKQAIQKKDKLLEDIFNDLGIKNSAHQYEPQTEFENSNVNTDTLKEVKPKFKDYALHFLGRHIEILVKLIITVIFVIIGIAVIRNITGVNLFSIFLKSFTK